MATRAAVPGAPEPTRWSADVLFPEAPPVAADRYFATSRACRRRCCCICVTFWARSFPFSSPNAFFNKPGRIVGSALDHEPMSRGLLLIFLENLLRQLRWDRVEGGDLSCDLLHIGRRKLAADQRPLLPLQARSGESPPCARRSVRIWRGLRSLRSLTQPGLDQASGHGGFALCLLGQLFLQAQRAPFRIGQGHYLALRPGLRRRPFPLSAVPPTGRAVG